MSFKRYIIEDLEIISAGAEGKAVGKVDGLTVFVPYAVPGDIVDVEVYKRKRGYADCNLLKIKRPSPDRVAAPCPHFGSCGGCKWQMLSYEKQLEYKQRQVEDNFRHLGKFEFPPLLPIIGSEKIYYYRNKLEYTFSTMMWLPLEEHKKMQEGEPRDSRCLGFHVPGMFDKILDIKHCWLQAAPSNDIRLFCKQYAIDNNLDFYDPRQQKGLLRNIIIRSATTSDLMVVLIVTRYNDDVKKMLAALGAQFPQITSLTFVVNTKLNDAIFDLPFHLFSGNDFITEKMENLRFKVGPKSFYQTNSEQAYNLYKVVRDFAATGPEDVVYDLFTGTGTIANFVAHQAKRVVGIEYVDTAVEDAKINSAQNGIENTEFVVGDMAKIFTDDFIAAHGRPDVIISDPPRAGMHPNVIEQLLKLETPRIVYVSCNPATQARDLTLLDPKYSVEKVQPVDMFPHTQHVENVVLLKLRRTES
ncbi:MAG: 23S rRNA (uracil(1939)-C(5))-methyltransferase RlmD [Bacteroidales bacterium]|nr:23S rRNA (uracil(1939)-C(5))-methyltransferase RlmD [Bacteroidales bacterium]